VSVGVWCDVSARRIVVPVLFNEIINCDRYVQIILGKFFPELTEEERLWLVSARLSYCPHCTLSMKALSDVFGDRIISSGI
jgi:hypothetical protein